MTLDDENPNFPLTDAIDASIVMHRDAHFGGLFGLMLEYYARGGKGVNPEFDIERIEELARYERESNQNLAGILLTGSDAEKVARSRELYKELKELYNADKPFNKHPKLIADLILSETEDAEEEIEAIVKEKGSIVNALIEVIKSEDLHDPLFPGFGLAPSLAVKCLGLIGDKRAIITLFEAIDSGDFFDEEVALHALYELGEPAKQFLLKVLHGQPLTSDNEKAALALIQFKEDPEVKQAALAMLQDPKVRQNPLFPMYLTLLFEGLDDKKMEIEFNAIAKDTQTPSSLRKEMQTVAKTFVGYR